MPIYEYHCGTCDERVAVMVRSSGTSPACPDCGSPLTNKLFSAPNIIGARSRHSAAAHCDRPDRECCGQKERGDRPPCSEGGGCMCHN
jgi:putative FmdB family regulatory protein